MRPRRQRRRRVVEHPLLRRLRVEHPRLGAVGLRTVEGARRTLDRALDGTVEILRRHRGIGLARGPFRPRRRAAELVRLGDDGAEILEAGVRQRAPLGRGGPAQRMALRRRRRRRSGLGRQRLVEDRIGGRCSQRRPRTPRGIRTRRFWTRRFWTRQFLPHRLLAAEFLPRHVLTRFLPKLWPRFLARRRTRCFLPFLWAFLWAFWRATAALPCAPDPGGLTYRRGGGDGGSTSSHCRGSGCRASAGRIFGAGGWRDGSTNCRAEFGLDLADQFLERQALARDVELVEGRRHPAQLRQ